MTKENLIEKLMNEPQPLPRKVPDYMRQKGGIWYWTGAMIMIAFFYEVMTGVILFFYYQPSNAYISTENTLHIPYGTVIMTTHLYGAYIMIALVYIHLLRNLFVGSYKKPRQVQWLTGIVLMILTVAISYFGYSMTGDVLSADATDVGRGIANGFPVIGSYLSTILLGNGSDISLFSRLEGWHIILAGSILILFAVHFFLAEYNTIMPSAKETGFKVPAIDKEEPSYKPWYPYNLLYMVQIAFFTIALIFIIPSLLTILPNVPALFSPLPQVAASSPLASSVPPYPPWFLLFVYKELDFQISTSLGPFWAVVLFTGLPLGYLFVVPYFEKKDTLKITKRNIVVSTGVVGLIYLFGLSAWGALEPGIPVSNIAGLLFFIIPLAIVIPLTYYLANRIELGKSSLGENAWKVYAILPILGFISILTGISAYSVIVYPAFYNYTAMIILLVILGLTSLATFALVYGVNFKTPTKKLTDKGHLVFGSIYAFLAIAIIAIISVMSPTQITSQGLYGVGMALLFTLAGAFVKLYRSHAFKE